jgi:hypothetical protein
VGYRLGRVEQPVDTEASRVVVDVIHVCRERSAALAIECKDGTVQKDQAGKYDALQPIDLVQTGGITLDDPGAATVDVAYAMAPEHVSSALRSLQDLGSGAGVLEIGPSIIWHGPPAKDPQLRDALSKPIAADMRALPRLLIVDDQSAATVLAEPIANALHAAILQGRESVTVATLIETACWGWPSFARGLQGRIAGEVKQMLSDAAQHELRDVLTVEKGTQQAYALVRLKATSAAATQAGEVREARAVRAKLNDFVARVTGKPTGQLQIDIPEPEPDEREDDA